MGFICDEDYPRFIKDNDLDDVTDFNDLVKRESELDAQAIMESYLRDRFDVASVFAQTGKKRNREVVKYLLDIAIYNMFCANVPNLVTQVRTDNWKVAMAWLDKVRDGKINPNLPANTDERGKEIINSTFSSNPQNGYRW